MLRNKEEN